MRDKQTPKDVCGEASDRDDQTNFLGLEFSFPGFLGI